VGVVLGFASAALASSGAARSVAHLRPLLPSGQVGPPALSQWPRVPVHHVYRASASIVGGVGAAQGELGFMAFILHFDALGNADFACSGTVISANVVLTAGHCAVDESTGAALDPGGFRVVTGAVDWTDTVNRRVSGVSQVIVDPAYNRAAVTSDAALLVLSTPTAAPAIRLAGSADQNLEQAGTGAVIAGWGATYAGDPYLTHVLQWASTVVQSSAYCGQFSITYNPAVKLCTVDPPYSDTGTCTGDSGGPLLASDASGQPVEIGVTSTGPTDCNTVTADYFTAVLPLSSWASSWIRAVAPPSPPPPPVTTTPPPVTTTPPPSSPSQPQLPRMTLSDGRSYVRQTVAGVLPLAFKHQHAYGTSCTRKSAVRISCNFGFWSGPNDYWGTVTVYYLFGSNHAVQWTDTYTIHSVNDQRYYHSTHRSRCRTTTKRGSW
jgi:secreted trypsin-like serine protease